MIYLIEEEFETSEVMRELLFRCSPKERSLIVSSFLQDLYEDFKQNTIAQILEGKILSDPLKGNIVVRMEVGQIDEGLQRQGVEDR